MLLCIVFLYSCSKFPFVPNENTSQPETKTEKVIEAKVELVKQVEKAKIKTANLSKTCFESLKGLPGKAKPDRLEQACNQVKQLDACQSVQNRPIYHFDKMSQKRDQLKILTIALVHGDEFPAGSVARSWMERLTDLDPRNSWRIIPVANPDGLVLKTRPNANGVDINRNFPTKNWDVLAHKLWKERYRSTWRKYPGPRPASEIETLCLIEHIKDFKPDFIISVHTPLGHLDFDGPKMKYPDFNILPWKRFGHYPGSLGRYMWRDNSIPVLTIELKGNSPVKSFDKLDSLQDISGNLAIKAMKELGSHKISSDN